MSMTQQRENKVPVNWTVRSWERGYRRARNPDVPVWIDIEQFDDLWARSDQYIAAPGDAPDNQPEKYAKVGRRFLAGEPDPALTLNSDHLVGQIRGAADGFAGFGRTHTKDAAVGLIGGFADQNGVPEKHAGPGERLDDPPGDPVGPRHTGRDQGAHGRGALGANRLHPLKPRDPRRDVRIVCAPEIPGVALTPVGPAGGRAVALVVRVVRRCAWPIAPHNEATVFRQVWIEQLVAPLFEQVRVQRVLGKRERPDHWVR